MVVVLQISILFFEIILLVVTTILIYLFLTVIDSVSSYLLKVAPVQASVLVLFKLLYKIQHNLCFLYILEATVVAMGLTNMFLFMSLLILSFD